MNLRTPPTRRCRRQLADDIPHSPITPTSQRRQCQLELTDSDSDTTNMLMLPTNLLGSSQAGFTCSPISSLTAQTTNPKPPTTYFRPELVTRNSNELLKISELGRALFIPTLTVTATTWTRVRRVKTSPTKRSRRPCYSG
jgi:hypothetical protein